MVDDESGESMELMLTLSCKLSLVGYVIFFNQTDSAFLKLIFLWCDFFILLCMSVNIFK